MVDTVEENTFETLIEATFAFLIFSLAFIFSLDRVSCYINGIIFQFIYLIISLFRMH